MVERKPSHLEPLLIPTLRLLVAAPLVIVSLTLLLDYLLPGLEPGMIQTPVLNNPIAPYWIRSEHCFVAPVLIAFLMLIIPTLPRRLGRWFLPSTLFFCALGPMSALLLRAVQFYAHTQSGATAWELLAFFMQGMWPTAFYLLIPLIVIAWQYSFREVVFYAIALGLIEAVVALALTFNWRSDLAWLILQFAIGRTVVFISNGYLVSQLVTSQRQQRAELALANSQLTQYALTQEQLTVSRERNRLARDLHDTLAHYMSGLVLQLEGTRLLWEADSTQARTTLDHAVATARTGLTETRRALQALRATPLTDLGLTGAIRELAESMATRNQWQLELQLPTIPMVLTLVIDEVIYRIVQESLTNIERHAEATTVTVTLTLLNEQLVLRIADDGCGFAPEAVDRNTQFGLLGMQERARLVDGVLTVESTPGRGSTVTFTLRCLRGGPANESPRLALMSDQT